jgi:para-nitrobenzyl esterase
LRAAGYRTRNEANIGGNMFKLSKRGLSSCPRQDIAVLTLGTAIAVGLTLAAGASPVPPQSGGAPVVQTSEGPVQGFQTEGVAEFLGIPYAAPPVGNLRWRPPVAHAPWKNVLRATKAGPICLQVTTLGPFAGPANDNEDCLFLNVYSANIGSRAKEPVFVWIHGGGNVDGGSTDYDGSKLAREGHTVVVTLNYRLGLLGFMAHPAIDAEGHLFGNYGTLDQQFVLKWVRQNIANFGGDPNNVTLGGQSAGSVDTESNVISPLAKGLFHRAIFESILLEPTTLATAETNGTAFAVAAGCGSGTGPSVAACLRALPASRIFTLSGTASTEASFENQILRDGQILPNATFTSLIAAGQFNHMPIMGGTVQDEENFFLGITEFFESTRIPATQANYTTRIAQFPAAEQAQATSLYPEPSATYSTPQLALDAIGTDSFACSQRFSQILYASQVPVYAYEFDDRTAPSYFPVMPGFVHLAYHTSDIQYLFPLWHGGPEGTEHPLNRQQENLSDELVAAWTNFASTGNPNGHGNFPWPVYTPSKPNAPGILSEGLSTPQPKTISGITLPPPEPAPHPPGLSTFTDAQFNNYHHCDFWDSFSTN